MNKKVTTLNRERADLELEVFTSLKSEYDRAKQTKFEHTMFIDKDKRNEEILRERQAKEVNLLTELIKAKEAEIKTLDEKQKAHDDAWKGKEQI